MYLVVMSCTLCVRRYIRRPETNRKDRMSVNKADGDCDDDFDRQSADDGIVGIFICIWHANKYCLLSVSEPMLNLLTAVPFVR